MKTMVVYTKKLAYALRVRGFKIIETIPDMHKPQFDNYVFEDTVELRKAIAEILA